MSEENPSIAPKTCKACGKTKPRCDFPFHKYRHFCNECQKLRRQQIMNFRSGKNVSNRITRRHDAKGKPVTIAFADE